MAPFARHFVPNAVRGDWRHGQLEAIEESFDARLDWLRQFVPLENGIPSHDTLSLSDFLCARGHEMIPKGKHNDRSNEHDEEDQETKGTATVLG